MTSRPAEGNETPIEDLIPIGEIIAAVRTRWLLAASVALIFSAFSIYGVMQLRSLFRASVLLAPAATERAAGGIGSQLSQLSGLASLVGIGIPSNATDTEQALAVLESREFTDHFIRKWKLFDEILPNYTDDDGFPQKGLAQDVPIPSPAIDRFRKKFRHVIRDKKTGLVEVQIDWYDPKLGATLANDMVQLLNVDLRARAIHSADESLKYLQTELQATESIEIRQAINALIENQEKQRMLATVNEDYAFRVIDPAVPAEKSRPVAPPRAAYVFIGTLFGSGLGVLLAWILERRAKSLPRDR